MLCCIRLIRWQKPRYSGFDTIVNVQGDEPFVSGDAVRGAVGLVSGGAFPLGTAAARANPRVLESADVLKVVTADDGRAMYFSRAGIPWLRDGAETSLRDRHVAQHIGIYAYAREALSRWVRLSPRHRRCVRPGRARRACACPS